MIPEKTPGSYCPWHSMTPLTEGRDFFTNLPKFIENNWKAHNATVFRTHAGLKQVFLTCWPSVNYYFSAPLEELSREDKLRLGPAQFNPELAGKANPAVLATGEKHQAARNLTLKILQERNSDLEQSLHQTLEEFAQKWEDEGEFFHFESFASMLATFSFRWLLGVEIDPRDAVRWTNNSFYLGFDSPVAQMIDYLFIPKSSKKLPASNEKLIHLVRNSPYFDQYRSFAREAGVTEESLEQFMIFLCLVNATGANLLSGFPSHAQIMTTPAVRTKLLEEVDSIEIIPESSNAIVELPYLDAVFMECLRMYQKPRTYSKVARKDLVIPSSSGKQFKVNKGELMTAILPYAHRDPNVFEDPTIFSPERFVDKPSLKDRVFKYGMVKNGTYGCGAMINIQADRSWKYILSYLFSTYEWDFVQQPMLGLEGIHDLKPLDLKVRAFRKRGTPGPNTEIDLHFKLATSMIMEKEVKVSKEEKVELSGFYKQALYGNCHQPKPSGLGKNTSKWQAWKDKNGLSSEEAKRGYIDIVKSKAGALFPVLERK